MIFNKFRNLIILLVIIILVVVLHQLGWLFLLSKITLPLQKIFFQPEKDIFLKKSGNFQEAERLKEEIEKLTLENIRLKLLEKENEELKNELGFRKKDPYQRVTAELVGRKTEAGITWFILDQGEERGIKPGQAVVSGEVIIGKIFTTNKYFSYFLPLLDDRVAIGALTISHQEKINEKNKADGFVRGKWGLTLEMDWIPLSKKMNVGDYVITSGLEENIPRGLLIGKIEEIETKPGALFQKALIRPEKRVEELEVVSVILK